MSVPLLSQDEFFRHLELQSVHKVRFTYRQALKERLRATTRKVRQFFFRSYTISHFPCIPRKILVFMCSDVGLIFWQILIVAGECVNESRGKGRAKVGRRRRFASLSLCPSLFSHASSIRGWTVILSLFLSLFYVGLFNGENISSPSFIFLRLISQVKSKKRNRKNIAVSYISERA